MGSDYANEADLCWRKVSELDARLNGCENRARTFNRRESIFHLPQTNYTDRIRDLRRLFEPHQILWTVASKWVNAVTNWLEVQFETLNGEMVATSICDWHRQARQAKGLLRAFPDLYHVAWLVEADLANFEEWLPVIEYLRMPGIRQRHWRDLALHTGAELTPGDMTIVTLMRQNMLAHVEFIAQLCSQIEREFSIETRLEKMRSEWKTIRSVWKPFDGDVKILGDASDVLALVDRHIIAVQVIRSDPFVAPFAFAAQEWEAVLIKTQDNMFKWLELQRQYVTLHPLFGSERIANEFASITGQSAQRFSAIDSLWQQLTDNAEKLSSLLAFMSSDSLQDGLKELGDAIASVEHQPESCWRKSGASSRASILSITINFYCCCP